MKTKLPLGAEQLEDRLTPSAYATMWADASHLTLSFTPDGTNTGAGPSNLFASLSASSSPAAWEQTILRAFQTWAVNSNINIGVVADDGSPLGTPGAVEGDFRFGDVRIAAGSLPSAAVGTTAFFVPGSTWSGDMILNSNFSFGAGTYQYDLFTVALHEAGHVFNLEDNDDPNSGVMYTQYRGPYSGLLPGDAALLQSIYGTRTAETQNNSTIQTAMELKLPSSALPGSPLAVAGDISTNKDVDVYHFKTNGLFSPAAGLDVTLRASGLSLFQGKVTVFDRAGTVIASSAAADPLHNDVLIHLSQAKANTDYYVQVQSATSDVFGIGAYQLKVNTHPQWIVPNTAILSGIQDLHAPAKSSANAPLVGYDTITANSTSSLFRFQSQDKISYAAGANVTVKQWGVGVSAPTLTVYDAFGKVLATSTSTDSDGGGVSLHIDGVAARSTYYVMVQSDVRGATSLGAFTLQVDLNPNPNASPTADAGLLVAAPQQNNTLDSARSLQTVTGFAQQTTSESIGSLTGPSDTDFYHVKSIKVAKNQTSVLTVTVLAENALTLSPVVTVYDKNKKAVAASVQSNSNGVFVVVVANAASNADYYIQVSAGAGSGPKKGNYFLRVDNSSQQPIVLQTVAAGTLTQTTPQQFGTFNVASNQLFNFVLSANVGASTQAAAVQMNVYDGNGGLVVSLIAKAGQPDVTQMVYLGAGTYTVRFTAAAQNAAVLPPLSFSLGVQSLSQPIGPAPLNPTSSPTSSPTSTLPPAPPTSTTAPVSPPPATTVMDPASLVPPPSVLVPPLPPTTSTAPVMPSAPPSSTTPTTSSPYWTYTSGSSTPPATAPVAPYSDPFSY